MGGGDEHAPDSRGMAAFQPLLPMESDYTNQGQAVEPAYYHALFSRETRCEDLHCGALVLLHGFGERARLQLQGSEPEPPKHWCVAGAERADLDVRRH